MPSLYHVLKSIREAFNAKILTRSKQKSKEFRTTNTLQRNPLLG